MLKCLLRYVKTSAQVHQHVRLGVPVQVHIKGFITKLRKLDKIQTDKQVHSPFLKFSLSNWLK